MHFSPAQPSSIMPPHQLLRNYGQNHVFLELQATTCPKPLFSGSHNADVEVHNPGTHPTSPQVQFTAHKCKRVLLCCVTERYSMKGVNYDKEWRVAPLSQYSAPLFVSSCSSNTPPASWLLSKAHNVGMRACSQEAMEPTQESPSHLLLQQQARQIRGSWCPG